MDVARLSRGEMIAGISGLALFLLMFFAWYSAPDVPGEELVNEFFGEDVTDVGLSAWNAYGFIDIVLLVTVIVAVGGAGMAASGASAAVPISAITTGMGALATVLVIFRVLDTPFGYDRGFWLFLGLAACVGVAAGGWMAMQEEGTTFGSAASQAGDRLGGGGGPGAAPPPPPPPPPAAGGPPSAPPPAQ